MGAAILSWGPLESNRFHRAVFVIFASERHSLPPCLAPALPASPGLPSSGSKLKSKPEPPLLGIGGGTAALLRRLRLPPLDSPSVMGPNIPPGGGWGLVGLEAASETKPKHQAEFRFFSKILKPDSDFFSRSSNFDFYLEIFKLKIRISKRVTVRITVFNSKKIVIR